MRSGGDGEPGWVLAFGPGLLYTCEVVMKMYAQLRLCLKGSYTR